MLKLVMLAGLLLNCVTVRRDPPRPITRGRGCSPWVNEREDGCNLPAPSDPPRPKKRGGPLMALKQRAEVPIGC